MRQMMAVAVCGLGFAASAGAAVISINTGNGGSATERGIAFNLTNNSTTETVELTGFFAVPITVTTSQTFSLWTRDGTVVNNIGAGATNWTSRGTATAIGQGYNSPFPLTEYNFASAAGVEIAPGATLGIWLKDSDLSSNFRYLSGGSNTVSSTDGFSGIGSLSYTGYVGLGATGSSPDVAQATFGPTRNFMGQVGYTVVAIPEPTGLLSLGLLGLALRRRR